MFSLLQAARSPRLVGVNLDDLIALAALKPTARDGDHGPSAQSRDVSVASGFLTTPGAAAQLAKLEPGAMMLYLRGPGGEASCPVVCWKGWETLSLYVQKDELQSLRVHLAFLQTRGHV